MYWCTRFDVEGYVTGFGNPDWERTHSVATSTAPAVMSVLKAGATCVGKTVMDEMAYRFVWSNMCIQFLSMWHCFLNYFFSQLKERTLILMRLTKLLNSQLVWLMQLLLGSHELLLTISSLNKWECEDLCGQWASGSYCDIYASFEKLVLTYVREEIISVETYTLQELMTRDALKTKVLTFEVSDQENYYLRLLARANIIGEKIL